MIPKNARFWSNFCKVLNDDLQLIFELFINLELALFHNDSKFSQIPSLKKSSNKDFATFPYLKIWKSYFKILRLCFPSCFQNIGIKVKKMAQKTKFIMKAPLHEAADKILNISGQNSCLAPLAACILPVLEDLLIHSFEALLLIKKSGFFYQTKWSKMF